MGSGLIYHCEKCGDSYSIMLDSGMGYPIVYDEIMEQLFEGKFGKNLQKIVTETKNVVVDAKEYLFVCEKCDYFDVHHGLDLYQVKNEKLIKESTDENKNWIKAYAF